MYAYPECLYFFKTTFRSVVKILGYIYASEEDSLCIHSATKAAKREGWCSHETLLSRHSFLEKHRKIHLDHLWQGTNRCASPFVNASSRFWFEFDLSSQLTENIHREIHTHSTWCHHCPEDGHHHAAILPKDTFHASSSWDHPQSKFNSVKLAASLFFDLMDMISRSLLTDTSLMTSYSSLSHRITYNTAASLALPDGTGQEMLTMSRDLQTACSRSRKKWGTIQMDPAPSWEQGSCFKDSPNPLRWNTQGLALCNHLGASGHIFIWSPRTKTSQVGSILWVRISFRLPFLQLIS